MSEVDGCDEDRDDDSDDDEGVRRGTIREARCRNDMVGFNTIFFSLSLCTVFLVQQKYVGFDLSDRYGVVSLLLCRMNRKGMRIRWGSMVEKLFVLSSSELLGGIINYN